MAHPSSNFPSASASTSGNAAAAAAAYAGGRGAATSTSPVVRPATTSSASAKPALGEDVLNAACKTNDLSKVLFAIEIGARPNSETLTWACLSNDPRIVEEVLKLGATPDHATLNGACSTGNFFVVVKAIAANALPNKKTMEVVQQSNDIHIINMVKRYIDLQAASAVKSGGVPQVTSVPEDKLTRACKTGNCELVKKAIKEEAFPDEETLYWAVKSGDREIVELVIARGANPSRYDETHTESLLSFACELGNTDIIEQVLLAGSKPTKNTLLKLLPHLLCIRQYYEERSYGAEDLCIGGKQEPHDNYFAKKFRSLAEVILRTGPVPPTETLNVACKNHEEWIVLELIKLRVKPDQHTLIYAIEGNCVNAITGLLACGASTEGAFRKLAGLIRKERENTERLSDCWAIFRALIESGANMNEATELLTSACKNGEDDLALTLLNIGVKSSRDTLFSAIEGTCLNVVNQLLTMRFNKEGTLIFTLRLIASMLGKAESRRCDALSRIFAALVSHDAKMDQAGLKEATDVLNLACKKSEDSVALSLLSSGVQPSNITLRLAVDGNCGATVDGLIRSGVNTTGILEYMIRPNSNGVMFQRLLNNGVKCDSNTFKRAVDFACEHRNAELMTILCHQGYGPATSAEVLQVYRAFGKESTPAAIISVASRKTLSETNRFLIHVRKDF